MRALVLAVLAVLAGALAGLPSLPSQGSRLYKGMVQNGAPASNVCKPLPGVPGPSTFAYCMRARERDLAHAVFSPLGLDAYSRVRARGSAIEASIQLESS
jgi:hypothetical protein